MEISCYRDRELAREPRYLPAITYNLAHTLLARSPSDCLFVPIRSMQYMAIIDAEEIIFLDGERKCWVDIAWRHFHPQARGSLGDPVAYDACYYQPGSAQLMFRLQAEFARSLGEFAAKNWIDGNARVIKFPAHEQK
ncbi:MAG: hypothetical protein ABI144_09570 [Gallionella sp.]